MLAQKRKVQVTLDIECYDDLDLEELDWDNLLDLEGDEKVHYVNIKENEVFFKYSPKKSFKKTNKKILKEKQ